MLFYTSVPLNFRENLFQYIYQTAEITFWIRFYIKISCVVIVCLTSGLQSFWLLDHYKKEMCHVLFMSCLRFYTEVIPCCLKSQRGRIIQHITKQQLLDKCIIKMKINEIQFNIYNNIKKAISFYHTFFLSSFFSNKPHKPSNLSSFWLFKSSAITALYSLFRFLKPAPHQQLQLYNAARTLMLKYWQIYLIVLQ